MKITKNGYLQAFGCTVVVLSLIRCAYPQIAGEKQSVIAESDTTSVGAIEEKDSIIAERPSLSSLQKVHKIYSVPSFKDAFPDQNDVQLLAAQHWGVKPVVDRTDAESRKSELVYIGSNPFFFVDRLNNSIPYLVPRASVLLQDIGHNFFDSLYVKGIPFHKIIVTSVLRTKEDVLKLRTHNGNATENSCHLYGTTFDLCYNRYKTVEGPDEERRKVRNDTLKWVLSEVLRDMRQNNRCFIKYEVKQGCFHITVR